MTTTAFQSNAFQNNTFQIDAGAIVVVTPTDRTDAWIRKQAKVKFKRTQAVVDLENAIKTATTPPVLLRDQFTPEDWAALQSALAGPEPDYAAPLTLAVLEARAEEEDTELLLMSL